LGRLQAQLPALQLDALLGITLLQSCLPSNQQRCLYLLLQSCLMPWLQAQLPAL
jgi:hypothetical protein